MRTLLLKIFLFHLCIIYSCKTIAQDNYIDSLNKVLATEKEDTNKVNTLDYIQTYYWQANDYNNAMRIAQNILELAKKIDYKIGIADGYLNIGLAYGINKDRIKESNYFDTALNLYKATGNNQQIINCYDWMNQEYLNEGDLAKALEAQNAGQTVRQQTGDKQMIIDGYDRLKELYLLIGNSAKAFECVYAAQKIIEQTGDKKRIADGFENIASTFTNTDGNPDEALKYSLSALKLYKELNDKNGIATIYSFIGYIYYTNSRYAEALNKYTEALQILKNNGLLDNLNIANIYQVIAFVYDKEGDSASNKGNSALAADKYLEAEKNQLIALQKWKVIGYNLSIGSRYADIGDLNIKLKNLKTAKNYLDSGMTVYQLSGLKNYSGRIYYDYAKIDSIQGNYKHAFNNLRLYKIYSDSANNEEDAKKAVQVQMQYGFDKKDAVAKAEQDKKDADVKRIKNQQYFAIAALGIVVLAVIIIALIQFRNNKQKQKANLLLERQKEKIEATLSELKATQSQLIQSEKMASLGELTAGIAHEIQNPLNFVNNFSEVSKELIEELKSEKSKLKSEEQDEILNDIDNNLEKINHHGKRADAIVKGMLQHSRKNSGQKESTDINALCNEYLRLSYHGLRAKDKNFNAVLTEVGIKTDFDNTVGKINIVPQDIGRVLLNLFNNAFYAVNEKKKTADENYKPLVLIQTKNISDKLEIRVTDNGNGIPSSINRKNLSTIFYYKTNRTRNRFRFISCL